VESAQRGVGVVAGLTVCVRRCSSVLLGFRGRSGNEHGVSAFPVGAGLRPCPEGQVTYLVGAMACLARRRAGPQALRFAGVRCDALGQSGEVSVVGAGLRPCPEGQVTYLVGAMACLARRPVVTQRRQTQHRSERQEPWGRCQASPGASSPRG